MATEIVITPVLDEEKLRQQLNGIENRKEKIKVDLDTENINSADQNMKKLNNTVSNSNTIFGRLKNTISNTFSTAKIALTGYLMVLNEINKAGKNAKQTINELDKAVTDLSVATNMSRESVAGLMKDYNAYAKELKSTTLDISSAADDYLRAGRSVSEAQALIKDSIMLSKLGQIESGTATEDLLAVMNGYEMSIKEVNKALDTMVALDMKAAISSGEIANAIKYCASSADVAGLSFDKLSAMIATVKDKTQQSAETIGTFFNTLLSRYRNVKIGSFVDDDGEDLSEVETILNSLGIKLRESNQEFREFEKVIDEVALSWDSYSSVQQAAIAKAFSGTRNQNRFYALMEGYTKTLELTEVAANSAGTAIDKFNNSYVNSLEAKQNTLQASFESMIMNTDFSKVYAGILDATKVLIDFINQTNVLKGALTGLTVAGGIKAFLTIKTGVMDAYIALNKFQNALDIAKKTNISTKEYERLLLLSNGLSTSQMKLVLSTNSLSVAQKKELLMASGLSEQESILQLQTWKMTTANTGLTASTISLGNAFKGLWATLIANPLVVVTALVSGVVMAYQAYNQKLEETRQKNIETATAASENADKLKGLYNEYTRLASIQDRTTSEEEAFKTAVENITVALGDKAEILKNLTAGTDEYADALARVTKEELQSQAVTATIGRKSAEEELQSEIWSDWSGSKVSIDSNSKGKKLSDEAQKAVDIVSGSLKEFETINRTWKNISWDISSNDPVEALAFFNSLVEARKKLVLASEDDEALLDTEIYEDLNTAINTMSESLDTYIEKLYEEEKLNYMAKNGIPSTTEEYKDMESALVSVAGSSADLQDKFRELLTSDFSDLAINIGTVSDAVEDVARQTEISKSFEDAWASSFTSENDAVKKLGDTLLDLAEKGRLTTETFNEADSTEYFKNFGISADEAVSKINKLVDESKQLSSMSSQISAMANALWTKKSDGFVESDTLAGFDVEVRGLESWDRFQEVLGSTNSSYQECQEAANALATEWVNSSDFLAQLTEQNKEYYATQLEAMGVENYEEVISYAQALNEAKQALSDSSLNFADATEEEVQKLIDEGTYSELAQQQIWNLYYAKLAESETFLDSAADCEALLALSDDAMLTARSVELLNQLIQIYNGLESGAYSGNRTIREEAREEIERIKSELETLAKGEGEGLVIEPNISLNAKKSKKSGSGSGSKDTTKEFDWIEQAIENVEKEVKKLDEVVNSSYSTFSQKNEALAQEIGKVSEEIGLQQQAYEEYMRKADSIALSDDYKALVRDGAINIENISDENLQKKISEYQQWYDKAVSVSDAISDLNEQLKDLHVKGYELNSDRLEDLLKSESITEKQYLTEMNKLYKEYYENQTEYAQKAHEAKLALLEKEKSYLNSVANAAASLLDKEIDKIRDNAKAQEDSIKRQIDLLESRKKPLQDELDALEDKAKRENLILNLQKAQYDLAKAENQKSKLIYTEEKGFIYTSDSDAIKDAQKDVDAAKLEVQKQSIQDQIDALDDEIDRYNDLIDQINRSADAQIDALEKIKNKWQEVIDQQKYAQDALLLTGEFGANAISKIISGNDDDLLAQWKNSYINTLAGIDMESQGYIGDMTEQMASLYNVDLSPLQDQFIGVKDSVNIVTDALGEAANAIGAGYTSRNAASGQNTSVNTTPSTGTNSSLEDAIKNETDTAIDAFDQHTDKLTNEVIPAIQSATAEMNAFNEAADTDIEKTITINYVMTGDKPSSNGSVGKSYADGTTGKAFANGNKGLKQNEKNALRSEYGQPELTLYPDGTTELTNSPIMSDLPKDTIIFNEEQTKRILNGEPYMKGKAYANGSIEFENGSFVTADGHVLTPLREGDHGYDLMKAVQPMVDKILKGEMDIISNAVFEGQRQFEKWTKEITNNTAINNVTNKNSQEQVIQFNIGDITVQGIQDVTGFARAVKTHFPNAMLQEIHKR